MKVLFIIPHLELAASNRYRVYQYLPYLQNENIKSTVRPFVNSANFYNILYRKGHVIKKTWYTLRSLTNRLFDIPKIRSFDAVFIQRESTPFGPAIFERFVKSFDKYMIFDFDDAIYIPNISEANKFISRIKFQNNTAEIIKNCNQVIAGNDQLKKYALNYNKNVSIIPTSVDTTFYTMRSFYSTQSEKVTIGWIGSNSTIHYLRILDEVFIELSKNFPVKIKVIGGEYSNKKANVVSKSWNLFSELNELHSFDIGIMPVPDNQWTRGKCGLKAILYSSIGIPAVVSPVGVNTQIIHHGINGFHAITQEDWYKYLSYLIGDALTRKEMGFKGREIVENNYSLKVNGPKFVNIFKSI